MRLSFLRMLLAIALILPFSAAKINAASEQKWDIDYPTILIENVHHEIEISNPQLNDTVIPMKVDNKMQRVEFTNGKALISVQPKKNEPVTLQIGHSYHESPNRAIPLWFSIIPPLIAILFALVFKEVFTALLLGLLSGTGLISFYGGDGFLLSILNGLLRIVDTYIINSMTKSDHISIIVFSMLIGGMVGVISKNGGMQGVVNRLTKFASTRKSGQLVTWFLGMAVFFDDYANTLVIGNTMRPVADRLKISREKLSYIVDSTAAPIASIAFITTWIGAELSYIKNGVQEINMQFGEVIMESPYLIFLKSLSFSFYPIFTLIFVFLLIRSGRDYGPMLKAEQRMIKKGRSGETDTKVEGSEEFEADPNTKTRSFNAIIPVLIIIFGTLSGLVYTGVKESGWSEELSFSANLTQVIGNADSFKALLWSSFIGLIVAVILSVSQKLLSLRQSVDSMINGFRTMLTAILILILAWSLAKLTAEMHTADYLSGVMLNLNIAPVLVPLLTFILASLVAFSTGSSWGTMAILYPLILSTSWTLFRESNLDHDQSMLILYNVVSSILAGSVLGDHCSPISDTTILSSLATSCNHIDHVRTQLPYALTVGSIAILAGTIPASFGMPFYVSFIIGVALLWLSIRLLGKKPVKA